MARKRTLRTKKSSSRRGALLREIASLDREIGAVSRSLGVASRGPGRVVRASSTVVRRPNARRMNTVTVKDAIVGLLKAKKKPMHYRDIAATLLKERRYKTSSKSFPTTVAITIIRDRRVKRVEPGVYALRRGA